LLANQAIQILPPFVDFPNAVEDGNSEDDELTYTLRLAYDVSDTMSVYGGVSTGFKATSWNLSRDSRPFPADLTALQGAMLTVPNLTTGTRYAGPEESTVYELGLKARFAKGALNVAIFDQSIEGFQSNIFGGLGFNLSNAGEQSTTGLEFDLVYYPIEALQLTLAGTFLDPVYDSFVGALGPTGPTDLSGLQPAGIHEQSITTSATYRFPVGNGDGFVRADYLYEDEIQVVDNIPESVASREVGVLNASAGIMTENGWSFSVWGRNITDDEYLISSFPATFQEGTINGYRIQPSTWGITVSKDF
jgi:outer membrane receptor protein involved in Fe transport